METKFTLNRNFFAKQNWEDGYKEIGGAFACKEKYEKASLNGAHWSDWTFVKKNDSFVQALGKVALGLITLGGAQFVATIHDHFSRKNYRAAITKLAPILPDIEKRMIKQFEADLHRQDLFIQEGASVVNLRDKFAGLDYQSPEFNRAVQSSKETIERFLQGRTTLERLGTFDALSQTPFNFVTSLLSEKQNVIFGGAQEGGSLHVYPDTLTVIGKITGIFLTINRVDPRVIDRQEHVSIEIQMDLVNQCGLVVLKSVEKQD